MNLASSVMLCIAVLAASLFEVTDADSNKRSALRLPVNRASLTGSHEKATVAKSEIISALDDEEHAYWSRFLHDEAGSMPTPAPTEELCGLRVQTRCTSPEGIECNGILPLVTTCESQPSEVVLKYNGGDCSQSDNAQPASIFQCTDFNDKPPTDFQAVSHVVVTNTEGNVIFDDDVQVGGTFGFGSATGGLLVDTLLTVSIYDSNTTNSETILQTTSFDISCSSSLSLADQFGSVLLVLFSNEAQGDGVSTYQDVIFTTNVTNAGSTDVELDTLTVDVTSTIFFTNDVAGQVLTPGATILASNDDFYLDLSTRRLYSVYTEVDGRFTSAGRFSCQGRAESNFFAGKR